MSHIQQREASINFVLFAIFLHIATSTIYSVIPDDYDYSHDRGINYFTLQHYLNDTSKYFVSHNQIYFTPGQYYISDDLILKNVNNFSLIGIDQCVITCTSPASVVIINVTSFIFQNIKLINCIKSNKEYFSNNVTYFDSQYARDAVPFSKVTQYHTSVFLYSSSSVTISDMDVIATITASFTAVLIVNIHDVSKVTNTKIHINTLNCAMNDHPIQVSGIIVYYSDGIANESKLTIENFNYNNTYQSCTNGFNCVITLLFIENDEKSNDFALNIRVQIQNSVFNNLKNSTTLCYYGETNRDRKYDEERSRDVAIKNSTFCNNSGHHQLNMFYIVAKSFSNFSLPRDLRKKGCIVYLHFKIAYLQEILI